MPAARGYGSAIGMAIPACSAIMLWTLGGENPDRDVSQGRRRVWTSEASARHALPPMRARMRQGARGARGNSSGQALVRVDQELLPVARLL